MMIFKKPYTCLPHKLYAAVALSTAATALPAHADTKVVGYLPTWVDMTAVLNRTDLTKLTHLDIAFMNPTSSGATISGGNPACMDGINAATLNSVVQRAHQAGVKVLVSLAGGTIPGCSGNWETLLQSGNRTNTANNIVQFVNTFNLDGVDVDIEGDLMTRINNAGNYTPFIQALRNGLGTKILTAATGSYEGGMVPNSSVQYFDFISLMSYDAIGSSWGNPGDEHSTYNQAVTDINTWKARGLPKSKLVLGVPAYGYGFNGYASYYNYYDVINQFGSPAAQKDLIGSACNGCGYITYNGIPTVKNKTKLALQEGTGVMMWELSGDIAGANNLLAAINSQISSASSSSPSSFTALVQAENYSGMSGVQVETTTDSGGGQDVGWIDADDWMIYNSINIPAAGTYTISFRVASLSGNGRLQFEQAGGGVIYGAVNIPSTGGWQNWTTVNLTVSLPAGAQSFGIKALAGGWNFNWYQITAQSANSSSSKSSSIISTSSSARSSSAASSNKTSSASSKSSSSSSKLASSSSSSTVVSGVALDNPTKKNIAMQIVSSAENSTLDWRSQFAYIQDISDGRGYTAGIIGFCSGTGDMLQLVNAYTQNYPNNGLAKYLPALRSVNGTASHSGLDPNFTSAWQNEAKVSAFQAAQEKERDDVYFNPSVVLAKQDGIRALGQFAYYDAAVVHGYEGMISVRARALKKAKTPAQGGNEVTYLNAFMDERVVEMKKEAAHEDTSRIDTAQRVFLNNGNLDLNTPLSWKVYGDSFSIK